jgi:sterol desaturase/sphingolipid hydroxylase (fatty acid hydroxylase superfamily)
MIGIPTHWAFLVGVMTGVLGYGPVKRWWLSLRQALADQFDRPDEQRKDSRTLLLIFATMHPAPWLFLLGIPFAAYQLAFGPLPGMWMWTIAGIVVGVALMLVYDFRFAVRTRAQGADSGRARS